MRKWGPREVSSSLEWRVMRKVVVPPIYHPGILQLAHATPLAGHLGVNKTFKRILNHFYWPGIKKDVKRFCKTCDICQKVGKPFSQVVINCVGPLPKARVSN